MDFYHCIVLMHCFISGKICDYPLHNLSLSPIPPKNADGLPTKNIFFNILAPIPIARDRDCKSWHAHVALFSLEITTQQDLSFVMMLELVTYNGWLLYPWILRGSKWEGGGGVENMPFRKLRMSFRTRPPKKKTWSAHVFV